MTNMDLWDKVSKSKVKYTKKVSLGRTFTAIDPHSQIMAATEQFGPAGTGWGWSVERVEYLPTNEVAVLVRLWHGDHEAAVYQWGQAGLYIDKADTRKDGDCMKKATTDGLTKCLSYLGFNADVFLGQFDDNKYVAELTAQQAKDEQRAASTAAAKSEEEGNASLEELNKVAEVWRNAIEGYKTVNEIVGKSPAFKQMIATIDQSNRHEKAVYDELVGLFVGKKKELDASEAAEQQAA